MTSEAVEDELEVARRVVLGRWRPGVHRFTKSHAAAGVDLKLALKILPPVLDRVDLSDVVFPDAIVRGVRTMPKVPRVIPALRESSGLEKSFFGGDELREFGHNASGYSGGRATTAARPIGSVERGRVLQRRHHRGDAGDDDLDFGLKIGVLDAEIAALHQCTGQISECGGALLEGSRRGFL